MANLGALEIYEENLSLGEAWLFSGTSLEEVDYLALATDGRIVDVSLELGPDRVSGELVIAYHQRILWDESSVIRIQTSDFVNLQDLA